jgi:hypothetical protein
LPQSYSSKRLRDQAKSEAWDALPDSHFEQIGIERETAKDLQRQIQGTLVLPGDASYDQDRLIFNPIFNEYPTAILYCATEADVAVGLGYARAAGVGFAVRAGGHSTAGFSTTNGVLIDVSALDACLVNPMPPIPTVTVGPGCSFGRLDQTLNGYGLHVPGGECPDVCVGGYIQGGGYGFTSVSFGMSCDNVLALKVMLWDGSIIVADPQQNADLFWAMRGGTGGNFGVLLSAVYRLRPLGQVFGWALAWPLFGAGAVAAATNVMLLLQKSYMINSICGSDMTIQVSLCYQNQLYPNQPPPPNAPLQPYLMVRGLYIGPEAQGRALIQPLATLPGCIQQWQQSDSFLKMNDLLLNYPQSMPPLSQMPFEDKSSRYVSRDLSPTEWGSLLGYFATSPVNMAYGYLEFYGGAINAADPWTNAFVHRTSAFNLVMDVFWLANADRKTCEDWLFGWNALVEPMWNGEVYQNYCSVVVPDYAQNYWGPTAYPVLQAVKAKYDPRTLFAFRQGIKPSSATPAAPAWLLAALAAPIDYGGGAGPG